MFDESINHYPNSANNQQFQQAYNANPQESGELVLSQLKSSACIIDNRIIYEKITQRIVEFVLQMPIGHKFTT